MAKVAYLRYFLYDAPTGTYYGGRIGGEHTFTEDAYKAKLFRSWDDADLRRKIVERKTKRRLAIGVTTDRKDWNENESST